MPSRPASHRAVEPDNVTIRAAARRVGVGERVLRGACARGEVPLYRAPGAWPLVSIAEVRAWLRAHRAPVTDHAAARVDAVLKREARSA